MVLDSASAASAAVVLPSVATAAVDASEVACCGETRCVADVPKMTPEFLVGISISEIIGIPVTDVTAAAERPDFMSFAMNSEVKMKHLLSTQCSHHMC